MTRTAGRFCLLKALPSRLPGVLPLQETFAKSRGRERKDPTESMLKSCSERDAHGVTGVKSRVLGESHSVNTPRQATSTAGSMETFWAALDLHHFTSHRHGRHRRSRTVGTGGGRCPESLHHLQPPRGAENVLLGRSGHAHVPPFLRGRGQNLPIRSS